MTPKTAGLDAGRVGGVDLSLVHVSTFLLRGP